MPFTRVYLDSEPLTASQWPKISTQLRNLLTLVRERLPDATLYLPSAVEKELEAQFKREYEQTATQFINSPRPLNQFLSRAGRPRLAAPVAPPTHDVLASYRDQVAQIVADFELQTVPMTTRSLEDIFVMRLNRQRPFDADGDGLGDVLIYQSVLEHLQQSDHDEVAVIVSADGDYKGTEEVARVAEVNLRVMSLEDTVKTIRSEFDLVIRNLIDTSQQQASTVVTADEQRLTTYIKDNLRAPISEFTGFSERLRSVSDLERIEIQNVDVSPTFGLVDPGESVTLSVSVTAHFRASVDVTVYPPSPQVRVGEIVEPRGPISLIAGLMSESRVETREKQVTLTAEVEGTARRTDAGYEDLEWTSVRLQKLPPSLQALANLA